MTGPKLTNNLLSFVILMQIHGLTWERLAEYCSEADRLRLQRWREGSEDIPESVIATMKDLTS